MDILNVYIKSFPETKKSKNRYSLYTSLIEQINKKITENLNFCLISKKDVAVSLVIFYIKK